MERRYLIAMARTSIILGWFLFLILGLTFFPLTTAIVYFTCAGIFCIGALFYLTLPHYNDEDFWGNRK